MAKNSRTRFELLAVLMLGVSANSSATLYCNRNYAELPLSAPAPYNAVGFLNNGCTAFLIDRDHIAAAAHCFVDSTTGAWQTGLRFYLNFHPDRVAASPTANPRADVLRAVVGSRVETSGLGVGSDWGIARVGNWRDTGGVNLTPLALASSVPPVGTALENPAYTRHHFPFNDADAVVWDNMQFDTTDCGFVGRTPAANGGMWTVARRPAPIFDGTNRDPGLNACNTRWAAGYIHANCSLAKASDGVILHNCDVVGGSSGSPIIFRNPAGTWNVLGVTHGGGPTDFDSRDAAARMAPACTPDTPTRRDNGGPSVERFREAPRFASSIAVHRVPGSSASTAVFAVDSDRNVVVYRSRLGPAPTYSGNFSYWQSLGAPLTVALAGARLEKVAACSASSSNQPQVFVSANDGTLFTRGALSGLFAPSWQSVDIPASIGGVIDLDTTTDGSGRCLLLATGARGGVFARAKTSDTTWGDWFTVADGAFKSVSAINYAGVVSAAMVDRSGDIWRTSLGIAGWTAPQRLTRPAGVTAWQDVDFTWDEAARGFMVAIPVDTGNRLFFTPLYGPRPWSDWRWFDTHLWAPNAPSQQAAPHMQTITASRWMEDRPGTTTPVIFGTDDAGNVYFIEFARSGVPAPGWLLDWKSFYHEKIVYQ